MKTCKTCNFYDFNEHHDEAYCYCDPAASPAVDDDRPACRFHDSQDYAIRTSCESREEQLRKRDAAEEEEKAIQSLQEAIQCHTLVRPD